MDDVNGSQSNSPPPEEGGRDIKKWPRSEKARPGWSLKSYISAMHFETFGCERPPRLREIRWLRGFFIDQAATPPQEEGNTPSGNHSQPHRPHEQEKP